MAHYFTNDDVISEKEQITFMYRGEEIYLLSDHGVFSSNRVDYGSRVLLDTIDIQEASSLLDVGCGYGALGISLKKTHPSLSVDMVDVNLRALSLAREAIALNHLSGIRAFESDAYEAVTSSYDIIVTNPPIRAGKKVVSAILAGSFDHLHDNGRLIVVIQKKQGAPSAKKLMETVFGNCEILRRDKGYYILQSYKKHCEKF